jgi:two-component system response regulator HydG
MLKILVVDDDVCMCQLLTKVLRTCGHRVSCAPGGDEALALAAVRSFDAVICDLRMPRLDGIALMKKLHALDPRTAVVLMTAHADVRDAVEALRDGAFDFLLKPMPMPELVRCLQRVRDARLSMRQGPEKKNADEARASSASPASAGLKRLTS